MEVKYVTFILLYSVEMQTDIQFILFIVFAFCEKKFNVLSVAVSLTDRLKLYLK